MRYCINLFIYKEEIPKDLTGNHARAKLKIITTKKAGGRWKA